MSPRGTSAGSTRNGDDQVTVPWDGSSASTTGRRVVAAVARADEAARSTRATAASTPTSTVAANPMAPSSTTRRPVPAPVSSPADSSRASRRPTDCDRMPSTRTSALVQPRATARSRAASLTRATRSRSSAPSPGDPAVPSDVDAPMDGNVGHGRRRRRPRSGAVPIGWRRAVHRAAGHLRAVPLRGGGRAWPGRRLRRPRGGGLVGGVGRPRRRLGGGRPGGGPLHLGLHRPPPGLPPVGVGGGPGGQPAGRPGLELRQDLPPRPGRRRGAGGPHRGGDR